MFGTLTERSLRGLARSLRAKSMLIEPSMSAPNLSVSAHRERQTAHLAVSYTTVERMAAGNLNSRPCQGAQTPTYQRVLTGLTQGNSRLACPCGSACGYNQIAGPTRRAGLFYWPLT